MNATHEDTTGEWTALVAVRVPRDGSDDLVENARRRLEASRDVDAVEIVAMRSLDPGLSATTVHVEARVAGSVDDATIEDRLANAPGVQCVEQFRRA